MARRSTTPPPEDFEERIVDIDVASEMRESYLEYAYSVIYSRALPDVRDGLKPVQRRILFQMREMGLRPDRAHVKCGRVVGDVMGKLHPHGDGAIYDTLVRLAQPFTMRLPLVDGHGNFGSLDDGPAAYRYTECRMDAAAAALTDSLDEEVTDFRPNYDGQLTEPEVLPAAFPNLLVNGAAGIAVGMATNMPPHNLGEVVAACRHFVKHPDATLDDLMRFVPGPDLPCGAKIVGLDGIREAYEAGRGTFRMRATARIENVTPRRKGIVVTELPLSVGPEKVKERIGDLVRAKKVAGIHDVQDYTDRTQGLRLVIEIKSGFNPDAILEQLYKLTPLEESFGINNVTLVDGQPRTLGLRDLIKEYVEHRFDVVRRRTVFRRRKREERLHLVDGLLIALLDIDEVIQVVRESDDAAAAKARLMQIFDLSEIQAQYILDTPLRRLTRFDRLELEREGDQLRREIAELTEILDSDDVLRALVSTELGEVAKTFATPRRTVLLESSGAATTAAPLEVTDDPCWVLLSSTGLLARTTSRDELPADGDRARHDLLVSVAAATARGDVGAVSNLGRLRRLPVLELPALPSSASLPSLSGGAPLREFLPLDPGERIVGLVSLLDGAPAPALGTATGVVKRVVPDYPQNRDLVELVGLRDGDEVVGVAQPPGEDPDLVFVTTDAQLLRFPASAVRPQGRAAGGMAGVRLGAGAKVCWFGAVPAGTEAVLVTVSGSSGALPGTAGGNAKVTPFTEYPAKGRGTGGVRCHRFLKGEDTLVLAWAGPAPARASAASGTAVALPAEPGRRDGSGVPLAGPAAAVGGPPVPAGP